MSGALTFQNINQVILNMLDQMHNVCICIAMLIIFLSVYRNYQQFGEYLGIKYLAGVLLAIVFIALFPVMSTISLSSFRNLMSEPAVILYRLLRCWQTPCFVANFSAVSEPKRVRL